MGYFLQVNCAVGVVIWERDLGRDGRHAKSTRGITSSGITEGCWDDVTSYDKWRVGVALGFPKMSPMI